MKVNEIREISSSELTKKVSELKQELFALRFQKGTGQLSDVNKIKDLKKTIARILTVLKEREQQ